MTITRDKLLAMHAEAVKAAHSLARGERLAVLHGQRRRTFNDQGIHPFSAEYGRIQQLEALLPELATHGFAPGVVRSAAEAEADRMFRAEIIENRDAA